ncbi:hypothetical protein NDU88_008011 [Pleurodeles waltl]|uniref:Secreted protein n=1 Tax=Pleurodeles waltl TaxID=8319 RepID=A0AAV7SU59_PLEWA|nr:hypothetical protein NDU88_008011 [Pleurodeles waltl]
MQFILLLCARRAEGNLVLLSLRGRQSECRTKSAVRSLFPSSFRSARSRIFRFSSESPSRQRVERKTDISALLNTRRANKRSGLA